jgi:hypothetical protein
MCASEPSRGIMKLVHSPRPRGQKWATFLHNHAAQICACDFLQVTDLFFRPLFNFGKLHRMDKHQSI